MKTTNLLIRTMTLATGAALGYFAKSIIDARRIARIEAEMELTEAEEEQE